MGRSHRHGPSLLGLSSHEQRKPGAMEPRVTPNQPGEVVRKSFPEEGSFELGLDR